MNMYVGIEVELHHSSLRDWMKVSGQLHAPVALPLAERVPSTHWIGSLLARDSEDTVK
jgi:hypothetical protein